MQPPGHHYRLRSTGALSVKTIAPDLSGELGLFGKDIQLLLPPITRYIPCIGAMGFILSLLYRAESVLCKFWHILALAHE